MFRIKLINIFLFVGIFISLLSCARKETNSLGNDSIIPSNEEIVKYDNFQQLLVISEALFSMTRSELIDYEIGNGYESFGRKSEEFYESINFENFKTNEEILAFVQANSNYIELVEDGDGEMYIEPIHARSPFKYLMNEDCIMEIDGAIYKVFEDGLVATNENIELLKALDGKSCKIASGNNNFRIIPYTNEIVTKATNCGYHHEARQTVSRDRVLLELDISNVASSPPIHQGRVTIRPYKKTLGVWYWCSRTISYNINVAVYLSQSGKIEKFYRSGEQYDSKIEFVMFGGTGYTSSYFAGFNCWATTPSVDYQRAILQCNTGIL